MEREYQLRKMEKALLEATWLGDTEKVLELIASGVNVNVQGEYGMTAISIAGARDDKETFRVLYENRADVNIRDDNEWTAFMHISANGPLLHEEYSDIMDEVDIEKAEKMGDIKLVEELKKAKKEKVSWEDMQIAECEAKMKEQERVNQKNEKGLTPLHKARSVEEVKELLDKGADIYAKNEYGDTLLHVAARKGYTKMVNLLIEKGVDVNVKDEQGVTSLHRAAERDHIEVVKLLVDKGGDINAKTEYDQTPLDWAIDFNHFKAAQLLIEKGADINRRDENGNTPLHMAAQKGHEGIVKILLDHGATMSTKNENKKTPLELATQAGHQEITDLLRAKSAELPPKCQWTPQRALSKWLGKKL